MRTRTRLLRSKPGTRPALAALVLAFVLVGLTGCAGWTAYKEGLDRYEAGELEHGVRLLATATEQAPGNTEFRRSYMTRRDAAINSLHSRALTNLEANLPDAARGDFESILRLDPKNSRAIAGLERVQSWQRHTRQLAAAEAHLAKKELDPAQDLINAVLREDPQDRRALALGRTLHAERKSAATQIDRTTPKLKAAYRKPVSLAFRDASLTQVFESLKLASGINFMFDRDVKADTRLTISVSNKPLEDVIRVILAGQRLATRVLDEDTLLVYPNTPEKMRDYQELVIRTFYLGNADATKIVNLARNVIKVRDVYVDEKLNLLVMRDTAEVVRLAERVIANLDVPEPEVMLEMEVLEVSYNRLRELGIRFPDSISGSVVGSGGAGQLTLPEYRNRSSDLVRLNFNNPLVTLNLKQSDGDANLLANPRIRVKNRQTAKVLVGERVPVITTLATANVGTSESVSYLDVGLKLELEPTVSLDDDVSMKVALEVSTITDVITRSSGLQAYRLGTRNASTLLRVRDGETQVLAGLIKNEDRRSAVGIPILSDMPVLGRLFGSTQDNNTKNEIVLLITPRVVRNVTIPSDDRIEILSGTEAAQGASPIQLRPAGVSVPPPPGQLRPPTGAVPPMPGQPGTMVPTPGGIVPPAIAPPPGSIPMAPPPTPPLINPPLVPASPSAPGSSGAR